MNDSKKIAIGILSKPEEGNEEEGEAKMPPLEEVMQEFIDAVTGGDAKAAAKAFRGAMACSSEDEYEDEDAE